MPIPWGPIAGAAGNVIGGLLGKSGQSAANVANLKIARENRAFQERMSNTAYQRAAQDLSKAGLNRILAIGSPATTPAGNVATMQNENAPLADGINNAISQGLAAKRLQAEIKNINARTRLTDTQREALAIPETIGEMVIKGKERSGTLMDMANSAKEVVTNRVQTITGSKPKTRESFGQIARSVGLDPVKGRRLLIKTVRQMDIPKGWTDEQVVQWARENPEKIRAYMVRKGMKQ
ncbi:DNA pilot protein [Microviridae sp.]|nr:DNA pilot protein [Microviridae sp.]